MAEWIIAPFPGGVWTFGGPMPPGPLPATVAQAVAMGATSFVLRDHLGAAVLNLGRIPRLLLGGVLLGSAAVYPAPGTLRATPAVTTVYPASGVVRATPQGAASYPADPVLAIQGSWEDGTVLSRAARTNLYYVSSPIYGQMASPGSTTSNDGLGLVVPANVWATGWGDRGPEGSTMYSRLLVQAVGGGQIVPAIATTNGLTATDPASRPVGGGTMVEWTAYVPAGKALTNVGIVYVAAPTSHPMEIRRIHVSTVQGGRMIPTSGSPTTETDVTWDAATGRAVLARPLEAGATLTCDGQPMVQVDSKTWQATATVAPGTERDLTAQEYTYDPATGALTILIPLESGKPVTFGGAACTGSGGSWQVPGTQQGGAERDLTPGEYAYDRQSGRAVVSIALAPGTPVTMSGIVASLVSGSTYQLPCPAWASYAADGTVTLGKPYAGEGIAWETAP